MLGAGILFILSVTLINISTLEAANIYSHQNYIIVIEGEIKDGDFNRFRRLVKAGQGRASSVTLFSSGGNFFEAIKIGRLIRALDLATMIPRVQGGRPNCVGTNSAVPSVQDNKNCTCASACFFIHVGGTHRGGHLLAVHRPYFATKEYGNLTQKKAKKIHDQLMNEARTYLAEMDVPKHLSDEVLAIPSNKAKILSMDTIKTHFWGKLPFKEEWLLNKCGDYTASNDDKITDCYIEESRKSRIDAFQKYFGEKPDPANVHDYSVWVEAPNLLHKSPDQIRSSGGFLYKESGKLRILRKQRTFFTPDIQLFLDFGDESLIDSVNFVEKSNSVQLHKNIVDAITTSFGSSFIQSKNSYDEDTLVWRSKSKGIRGEMRVTAGGEIIYGVKRLNE